MNATKPSLVAIPATCLAVMTATLEQVADPMLSDDGAYVTPNDLAIREAVLDGWTVIRDTMPARQGGRDVYVTVLERKPGGAQ